MEKHIFFSENRETALRRLHNLAKEDEYYRGKTVKLARRQIPHTSDWKTWVIIKRR